LNLWMQFLLSHLDRTVPMAVFVPVGAQRGWADLVVGEIDGSQFYCLRASPKAMPLVTEIPYTLDGLFIRECDDRAEAGEAGGDGSGGGGGWGGGGGGAVGEGEGASERKAHRRARVHGCGRHDGPGWVDHVRPVGKHARRWPPPRRFRGVGFARGAGRGRDR